MGYTSFNRLRAGIESPQYTISAPVVPQAIDLRNLTRPKRGQAVAAMGGGAASPLAGLGDVTSAVIAAAKGPRLAQQQPNQPQNRQQQKPGEQQPQDANAQHRQATLDSYTQAAEQTSATGPTARHAYDLPQRGVTAASTRDSRGAADVWGNTVPDAADDAIGPEGSFGLPTFGRAPGTWAGGVFGGF